MQHLGSSFILIQGQWPLSYGKSCGMARALWRTSFLSQLWFNIHWFLFGVWGFAVCFLEDIGVWQQHWSNTIWGRSKEDSWSTHRIEGQLPWDSGFEDIAWRFLRDRCGEAQGAGSRSLQKAAADEAAANPDGPKWIIKVPDLPVKRPSAKVLTMLNCQINRSYCFETVLSKYSRTGVEIRNWIFSDANEYDKLQFDIQDKAPEFTECKSGYFQNPTWQQPALELGEDNAITRKWQSQKHHPSSHRNMQALPARSLAVLQRRDENRSKKALQKRKQKYKASKKERDNQSDVSLWEKTKQKCLKDRRVPSMENRRGPLNRRIKRYSILQQLNFGDSSYVNFQGCTPPETNRTVCWHTQMWLLPLSLWLLWKGATGYLLAACSCLGPLY